MQWQFFLNWLFFFSWGSMCEMWFPMQHWLKKENKKDIAADSLYWTVFCCGVLELGLIYDRKDSHLPFQLKLNEQIASISPCCLASLSIYIKALPLSFCNRASQQPFMWVDQDFFILTGFCSCLVAVAVISFQYQLRIPLVMLLSKQNIFLQLKNCC